MINSLKTNSLNNYFLVVLFAIIFWSFSFIKLPKQIELTQAISIIDINLPNTLFWNYFSVTSAFILFLVTAFVLNSINIKTVIIDGANQVPGFFYICFSGLYINLQKLTPELFANVLVLIAIYRILTVYNKRKSFSNTFDAGLLISMASFFHINILFLGVFAIIAISVIKAISIRETVIFILGVCAPYTIYISYLYLINDLEALEIFLKNNLFCGIPVKYASLNFLISLPVVFMAFLGIIGRITAGSFKKVIVNKYVSITVIFTVFVLIYYASPYANIESMIFLFAPISLLISNLFIKSGKAVSSVLLYGFIASIIIVQGLQLMYIMA